MPVFKTEAVGISNVGLICIFRDNNVRYVIFLVILDIYFIMNDNDLSCLFYSNKYIRYMPYI